MSGKIAELRSGEHWRSGSQPELAASLDNLLVLLSDLDRPEDALAAGEEAVTIAGS